MKPSERSRRLRAGLDNFSRVGSEVQSAFTQTEDALTALEDREARRSQRNTPSPTADRLRQAGV